MKSISLQVKCILTALFFSLWALVLRFQELAGRELWGDEIFQIRYMVGPFKPFWKRLSYGDMTSFPGDYLLTYPFLSFFGDNKWGLAIPHMCVTVLGFYLLYLLCRKYFKTVWGFVVAFAIVCFHEDLIFHSFEYRPYAVLPTLALGSFYLADILINQFNQLSLRQRCLLGGYFFVTMWFHAFGILMATIPLFYFLLGKRKEIFNAENRNLLFFLSILYNIALPIWVWYSSGNPYHESAEGRMQQGYYTFAFVPDPAHDGFWKFFNRAVFYNLIGWKPLYFLLGGWIFLVVVPFKAKLEKVLFFLTIILLPLELILFSALMNRYWFINRQYLFLAPLFAFFLGWLWDSAIDYYQESFKAKVKLTLRDKAGLLLMASCSIAGIVGIILRILK